MKNKKNRLGFKVEENAFRDDGGGRIVFPGGLKITDSSVQRNGTKYDIESMKLDEYDGMLTANHSSDIQDVIGQTFGLKKSGDAVTIDGIQFAVEENALALYAYNMIKSRYLRDFSIETFGPWPSEEDDTYYNSKLINLSLVTIGNNKSARINELETVAKNSLEEARKNGLDTKFLEKELSCYDTADANTNEENMKFVTIKNGRSFAVTVTYTNAAGNQVQSTIQAGQTMDIPEGECNAVENQIARAQDPQAIERQSAEMAKIASEAALNAMKPVMEKLEAMEKNAFNKSATEPEFTKSEVVPTNNGATQLAALDYQQRHALQINSFFEPGKDADLKSVNEYHFAELRAKGLVNNQMTIGDFGNFVISPELLTEIQGFRSDFSGFLALTTWRDTLSTRFGWLTRSGDIDMQSVEFCDDGADGNLKPISEYAATPQFADLEELAAVTPVCTAATRFLAVDMLADLTAGYRTDYDRKRAQLVIARLQQAVNATGNTVPYLKTSDTTAAKSWILMLAKMAEEIPNGTFIFNYRTYGELVSTFFGSANGSDIGFSVINTNNVGMILGRNYVVVPNELMPDLNTVGTKSFTVNGVTVTINKAVFYADLTKFTGRTSGGLRFDFSTEASYEVGDVVKSAWQRDELVARGYFYRGGAFLDNTRVVAMGAPGVS